ncbi:hypothetical protein [Providencia alcalifaciens]|uniref:hypothetical protein n=1 Tax=Providencia alcalifaciens TaxID=126385 RepID=UPI002AA0C7BC|nr:hypothetical protein [Providencia alcalifaciens]
MTSKLCAKPPKGFGLAVLVLITCITIFLTIAFGWLIIEMFDWFNMFPYQHRGIDCVWIPEPGCLTIFSKPTALIPLFVFGVLGYLALVLITGIIFAAFESMTALSKTICGLAEKLDEAGASLLSTWFKK